MIELAALPGRPVQNTPSDQMDMQVKNGLPGARAYVENSAVAVFDAAFACNVRGHEVAMADRLGIAGRGFLQAPDVSLGDHQHVGWALRINVLEGINSIVFVDFLGGYFAADDATEQTVIHDTSNFEFAVRQATLHPAAFGRKRTLTILASVLGR